LIDRGLDRAPAQRSRRGQRRRDLLAGHGALVPSGSGENEVQPVRITPRRGARVVGVRGGVGGRKQGAGGMFANDLLGRGKGRRKGREMGFRGDLCLSTILSLPVHDHPRGDRCLSTTTATTVLCLSTITHDHHPRSPTRSPRTSLRCLSTTTLHDHPRSPSAVTHTVTQDQPSLPVHNYPRSPRTSLRCPAFAACPQLPFTALFCINAMPRRRNLVSLRSGPSVSEADAFDGDVYLSTRSGAKNGTDQRWFSVG